MVKLFAGFLCGVALALSACVANVNTPSLASVPDVPEEGYRPAHNKTNAEKELNAEREEALKKRDALLDESDEGKN